MSLALGAARGQAASRRIPGRKLYQDEVYGTKELSPLAVAVMDTPEFQRLGYIINLDLRTWSSAAPRIGASTTQWVRTS